MHTFYRGRSKEDKDEDDYSHLNYGRSAVIMAEAQKRLEVGSPGDNGEEARQINDLRNEATLSLARILTKQGGVGAMLGYHRSALVRSHRASLPRGIAMAAASSHVSSIFPLVTMSDIGIFSGCHSGLCLSRRPD